MVKVDPTVTIVHLIPLPQDLDPDLLIARHKWLGRIPHKHRQYAVNVAMSGVLTFHIIIIFGRIKTIRSLPRITLYGSFLFFDMQAFCKFGMVLAIYLSVFSPSFSVIFRKWPFQFISTFYCFRFTYVWALFYFYFLSL